MGETGGCRLGGAVGTDVGGRVKDLGAAPQTGQLGQATRGCQRQRGAHPRGCRALLRDEKSGHWGQSLPWSLRGEDEGAGPRVPPRLHVGPAVGHLQSTASGPRDLPGPCGVQRLQRTQPSPGSKANPTAAARARSKATAPSSPTPPSAPPPAPRRSLLSGLQSRATAPQAGWSELHA